MNYDQLISYFKTQTSIARALGMRQPSVHKWAATGKVPALRQIQIEEVTGGALKADPLPWKKKG